MKENEVKNEEVLIQEIHQLCQNKAVTRSEENAKEAEASPELESGPNIVRLPMPQRSLIIFFGPPRYKWEHGILRDDIPSRRVCITYRELTPPYLPFGSESETGAEILKASKNFWNHYQYYGITCSSWYLRYAAPQNVILFIAVTKKKKKSWIYWMKNTKQYIYF